jgi:hypothetical protein
MAEFYNFQKHRRSGLPKVLQGKSLKSPDTQQAETQNPEVGSSTKQETLENLEKVEVSTQKGNIPETEILDNQGKDKKETIIKKEKIDRRLRLRNQLLKKPGKSYPQKSATPLRLSHHYSSPEETLIQRQCS